MIAADYVELDASVFPPSVEGLPSLKYLVRELKELNELSGAARVRRYMTALCSRAHFFATDPRSGHRLKSGSSFMFADKRTVYGFPRSADLLLVTDDLGQGNPIVAALIPSRKLMIRIAKASWGFRLSDFELLLAGLRNADWRPVEAERATLVVGDPNFAHSAWNHLPALQALLPLDPSLPILETHRPLGNIGDFVDGAVSRHVPPERLEGENVSGSLLVAVGSQCIPSALARRIIDLGMRQLSPRAQNIANSVTGHRTLWLSIRTRNRTADNQTEVLRILAGQFLTKYPQGHVILDGYSYGREPAPWSDDIVASDQPVATAVAEGMPANRTHVAVGLDILESIALGSLATVYFCHHGTLQHKVGWFSAVPGVVHCNGELIGKSPGYWVASMSETAVVPTYLPQDLVRDTDLSGGAYGEELQNLLFQVNYEFTDAARTAEFFMAFEAPFGPVGRSRWWPRWLATITRLRSKFRGR